MNSNEACEAIQKQIGELFVCTEHNGDYQRIRTPYLYPDGDNIDLFCKYEGDVVTVTDLAETTGWLRMQTISPSRSVKQNQLIADTCMTHGVEFDRGMLQARCQPKDSLAMVITHVAQAAFRVSDLWFTFRSRAVESITDEVADYLTERELPFRRREKLTGRSTKNWFVDFRVGDPEKSNALVYVLSTANRAAAHRVAEHVVAAWHDLDHLKSKSLRFVSLFDDTADVWAEENYKLVGSLSKVSHWSKPEEFAEELLPRAA